MKDHNPHDPVNMIGEAYELFVEKTMHDLNVHDGTDSTKPSSAIYRITKPEPATIQASLWIEDKKYFLKNSALEYLRHAADVTTITLRRLNQIQTISGKHDENEHDSPNDSSGQCANTSIRSTKNNSHQYKKCINKAFRRRQ